jgi:hypothetical protein
MEFGRHLLDDPQLEESRKPDRGIVNYPDCVNIC